MATDLGHVFATRGSVLAPINLEFVVDETEWDAALAGLERFSARFAMSARSQAFTGMVAEDVAHNLRDIIQNEHSRYAGTGSQGKQGISTVEQIEVIPGPNDYLVRAGGAAGYLEQGAMAHYITEQEPANRILFNPLPSTRLGEPFGPVRSPVFHPGFMGTYIAEEAMEKAALEGEFAWLAEGEMADAWNSEAILTDLGGRLTEPGMFSRTGIPLTVGPQGGVYRATGSSIGGAGQFIESSAMTEGDLAAFEAL
jgi:hypothetical protein